MATLKGRVLLGWMDRDAAVKFLLNDCAFDPPFDAVEKGKCSRIRRTLRTYEIVKAAFVPSEIDQPILGAPARINDFLGNILMLSWLAQRQRSQCQIEQFGTCIHDLLVQQLHRVVRSDLDRAPAHDRTVVRLRRQAKNVDLKIRSAIEDIPDERCATRTDRRVAGVDSESAERKMVDDSLVNEPVPAVDNQDLGAKSFEIGDSETVVCKRDDRDGKSADHRQNVDVAGYIIFATDFRGDGDDA